MSDEIKEILELIGNSYYYGNIAEEQKEKYCNYITNLQQENDRLKEENKKFNKWIETLNKENHRLNNIIKELEKWAKSIQLTVYRSDDMPVYQHQDVLDKLKELKESNNE